MRYYILTMTTQAGSGHPTSSLSGVELMAGLFFGGIFRYDLNNPQHPNNDRLIFSKGHASPLFYTLWAAAGGLSEAELMTYRHFGSPLEGHPTPLFPFCEAATGSLGQGLSIGVGQALNAKYLDKLPYMTYVLLGDSEMAEGSQWEALQLAAHYKLDNLVGILDVNRLGQRGETMYGWDLMAYENRIKAFGWETILVNDGHSFPEVLDAYRPGRPGGRPAHHDHRQDGEGQRGVVPGEPKRLARQAPGSGAAGPGPAGAGSGGQVGPGRGLAAGRPQARRAQAPEGRAALLPAGQAGGHPQGLRQRLETPLPGVSRRWWPWTAR